MEQPLMRRLLDTNVWIDAHAGKPDACRVFAQTRATQAAWIGFSSITKLEVLGYAGLSAADDKGLRELLAEFEEAVTRNASDFKKVAGLSVLDTSSF